MKKGLCDECSYFRELTYKTELDANLCESCYDLPTGKEKKEMKLNEYQELASRTIPTDKHPKFKQAEFSLALCEEAGESAGIVKKVAFHNHPFTTEKRTKLVEELGDTLWHIAALGKEFGITLEEIATVNVTKLMRRYPQGYSDERSVNRDLG